MRDYWVTCQLDPQRTIDRRYRAHSPWSAAWLHRQLHPAETVLMVRPVR